MHESMVQYKVMIPVSFYSSHPKSQQHLCLHSCSSMYECLYFFVYFNLLYFWFLFIYDCFVLCIIIWGFFYNTFFVICLLLFLVFLFKKKKVNTLQIVAITYRSVPYGIFMHSHKPNSPDCYFTVLYLRYICMYALHTYIVILQIIMTQLESQFVC